MMVLVMDHDGSKRMVLQDELHELIEEKSIAKFRREGEWAEVGAAPVRGNGLLKKYLGPERRETEA
jgi:hypothetical protein